MRLRVRRLLRIAQLYARAAARFVSATHRIEAGETVVQPPSPQPHTTELMLIVLRSLSRGSVTGKQLVPFFLTDRAHGGYTLDDASQRLANAFGSFEAWGLEDEVSEWGYVLPTFEDVHEALFQQTAILEWHTLPAYRDASLRMLAETVLSADPPDMSSRRASRSVGLEHDLLKVEPRATPTTAAAVPASVAAWASIRRRGMTEDEAATVIAAAERGRRARQVAKALDIAKRKAAWALARARSKAAMLGRSIMTEEQAATFIAAAERGRRSRDCLAQHVSSDLNKAAEVARRKAMWGAARAKSKAVLVTNLAAATFGHSPLHRSPCSQSASGEVSTNNRKSRATKLASLSKEEQHATYFIACPSQAPLPPLPPPRAPKKFHIYCSIHNAGASALLSEVHAEMRTRGLTHTALLWTEDVREMAQCEHFLLLCAATARA